MKSNVEWKKWGEIDPLYAVATWKGKERGSPDAWTDEQFYELGRLDWIECEKQWRQYGLRRGACVEIGCGAGRMTSQLAKYFDQVIATDVSQHQIDYAHSHLPAGSNVTFQVTNGINIPAENERVDAVFSVHVFQHFESRKDALEVFREAYRTMVPRATLMVGLPIYQLPDSSISGVLRLIIRIFEKMSDVKATFNRRRMLKGTRQPIMRRLRFEQQWLVSELQAIGFEKIEARAFAVPHRPELHQFMFATKNVS